MFENAIDNTQRDQYSPCICSITCEHVLAGGLDSGGRLGPGCFRRLRNFTDLLHPRRKGGCATPLRSAALCILRNDASHVQLEE
eukprot:6178166-Pleurochrysis_carterae.AAC.5